LAIVVSTAHGYYTTRGQDIVDRGTGEKVLLEGFGIGGWLLPEGYMWGIRRLDRPRQFEQAVAELIGEEDAAEFWRLYHENFLTEADIEAMRLCGVNSVRIALLASRLQPRQGQPDKAPFKYSEEGFRYLDRVVEWCSKYKVGVIWDMHGAPGAQNAENISDSDGQARLWTEKEKYWPRCIELWLKIVERYKDNKCIIGYDLLNEPLLRRYKGIDVGLLRQLYVELTKKIRTIDQEGIIFIEGDDWAQNFSMLEPLDWDEHLVIAFHSYPPTSNQKGLQRWDELRNKYNIPLWHGETGEQGPPYKLNTVVTEFLKSANVGWNWWTHKKLNRMTQPWYCPRTEGFQKILDYWRGKGTRPSKEQAKKWLFEQARKTHSDYCIFLPDMVRSLVPLNPDGYLASRDTTAPEIVRQPADVSLETCDSTRLSVMACGYPVNYQWYKNGKALAGENSPTLRIERPSLQDNAAEYSVTVSNEKGSDTSRRARLSVKPFSGPVVAKASTPPAIDATIDETWQRADRLSIDNVVFGGRSSQTDLSGSFRLLWDEQNLYVLVEVTDDVKRHTGEPSYQNDSVEIYVDYDNSKSDFYGDDEFQFRYAWSGKEVLTTMGREASGIKNAQSDRDNGYIMEMALPWSALGGAPRAGRYVGFDVHVNDNDRRRRECKIAWKAETNSAYRHPMFFGTIRLWPE